MQMLKSLSHLEQVPGKAIKPCGDRLTSNARNNMIRGAWSRHVGLEPEHVGHQPNHVAERQIPLHIVYTNDSERMLTLL